MKKTDNRQNKFVIPKGQETRFVNRRVASVSSEEEIRTELGRGGAVFGLSANLLLAAKIAQSAKHFHLGVHNFDKCAPLVEHARQKAPIVVILDWDGCEAEAFKVLKEFSRDADLKKVATVGCLSNMHQPLKEDAERAGCHRVYAKTEFMRTLDDILMRYAQ